MGTLANSKTASKTPAVATFLPKVMSRAWSNHAHENAFGLDQGVGHDFSNINVHNSKPNLSASPKRVQPKLVINQPGDVYEQEADAVADKVMRMPDGILNRSIIRNSAGPSLLRKCAHCEEEEKLQRKETGESLMPSISSAVERTLKSSGQPMDVNTRSFMEQRFDYNFNNVRIHNDSLAHQSSKDIGALAYTHGNHVVFGAGKYKPNTNSGKQLLAHELAHTIQQEELNHNSIQREITEKKEACAKEYLKDEISNSRSEEGFLSQDVIYNGASGNEVKGELLIADFGVDWRHIKESTKKNEMLKKWINIFEQDNSYRLQIYGYSDCVGESVNNLYLRTSRAHNVYDLLSKSLKQRTLITKTEQNSYYTNNSDYLNRSKNRSVVIKFKRSFDFGGDVIEIDKEKLEAISMAENDCKMASVFYSRNKSKAIGLFLKIYKCLTCSFSQAIKSNRFNDPLWVAKVNHATIMRLEQALSQRTGLYKQAMIPCDQLDRIHSLELSLDLITAIARPDYKIVLFQSCTEGVGMVHLLVDLTASLKEAGCTAPKNMVDFRDKIPPLFEQCNKAVLDEEFLIGGILAARHFAIPKVHYYRNMSWRNAGCYPY
ncbi:eCIS core domain-containing protein [Hymenobacter sp. HD11105]